MVRALKLVPPHMARVGVDISGGKKARSKKIFGTLTKVRTLNKTVEIKSLQLYSF